MRPSLPLFLALVLVAGCGQKGPLVRPDAAEKSTVVTRGPQPAAPLPDAPTTSPKP